MPHTSTDDCRITRNSKRVLSARCLYDRGETVGSRWQDSRGVRYLAVDINGRPFMSTRGAASRKRKSTTVSRKRKSTTASRKRKSTTVSRKRKPTTASRKRKSTTVSRKRKSTTASRKRTSTTASRKRTSTTASRKRTTSAGSALGWCQKPAANGRVRFSARCLYDNGAALGSIVQDSENNIKYLRLDRNGRPWLSPR